MAALGFIGKDSMNCYDLVKMTLKLEKNLMNYLIKKLCHAASEQDTIFFAKRTNHEINPIFLVSNFTFSFLFSFKLFFKNCVLYHDVPTVVIIF